MLTAARLGGCTCEPWVTFRHEHGVERVTVAHDEDCPMLGHASQLVVIPPRPGKP